MQEKVFNKATSIQLFVATMAWFALVLQLVLIIQNSGLSYTKAIANYFSYFTILTNFLVAIYFTYIRYFRETRLGRFFLLPSSGTAITMHIFVVGLVYNLTLRFLWSPTGLQQLVDELLHSVIPLLSLFYWWQYIAKSMIQFSGLIPWLAYPAIYFCYTLIRGSMIGWYPYPFMNVPILGYPHVLLNSLLVAILFVFLSWLFVAIAKWRQRMQQAG